VRDNDYIVKFALRLQPSGTQMGWFETRDAAKQYAFSESIAQFEVVPVYCLVPR
jgi:hypothetical protein